MPRSLRELADAIADKAGVNRAGVLGVGGAADDVGKQLTRALNDAGRNLVRRIAWQELITDASITCVAGQRTYTLAEKPRQIVQGYVVQPSRMEALLGPVDAPTWLNCRYDVVVTPEPFVFRFAADQIEIHPAPAGGEVLRFVLHSTLWVQGQSVPQDGFVIESDTPRLDDQMIELDGLWRFRRMSGFDYADERAEAEAHIGMAMSRNVGGVVMVDAGPFDATRGVVNIGPSHALLW